MELKKDRIALFVEALPTYRQGYGELATLTPEGWAYCALGVACEIALENGCDVRKECHTVVYSGSYYSYDGRVSVLPSSVKFWYGFDSSNPELTIEGVTCSTEYFNDDARFDFDIIAAAFRQTYLKGE